MKLPADYHMHSEISGDCTAFMEQMILSSISKGIKEICFTEHLDYDYPEILPDIPKGCFEPDMPKYISLYNNLSQKYKDKITIKFGIEIGLQPQIVNKNKDFVSSYPFDFVIGSIHLCEHDDPYYPDFWKGRSVQDTLRLFFEDTLKNIEVFDNFDVLGHLDYIVRYIPDKGLYNYSPRDFDDIITKILKTLISKGKGLDLNTKALKYPNTNQPNPHSYILEKYGRLGGKIITFGSDAHIPEDTALYFDKAVAIAKKCGFNGYYTFEKREKTFHPFT